MRQRRSRTGRFSVGQRTAGAVGAVVEGPAHRARVERRTVRPEVQHLLALPHDPTSAGSTLEPGQVVVDVVGVVAGEVSPEPGALDLVVAVVGDAHPRMQRAEDLRHAVGEHAGEDVIRRRVLELREVVGVPEPDLRHRRIESDLVHPPVGVAGVGLSRRATARDGRRPPCPPGRRTAVSPTMCW